MSDDELQNMAAIGRFCAARTCQFDNGDVVPGDEGTYPEEHLSIVEHMKAPIDALTAERDALLVRVERLEEAMSDLLSDLLGWECGGKEYIRRLHYERDDGKCDYCTGAWPCPAIEAQAVLTPEPGEPE